MKAKKFTRKDLLSQDSKTKVGNKLVFNFTCHPVNSKLNAQHRKVFSEVPIVGFKKGKKLGQKFQWKKKQMGNLVVVWQNAAKFALFQKKKTLLLTKRVMIHTRLEKVFFSTVARRM